MADITLEQVDQLGCKFSFSFKLGNTGIGYHASVEFKLKKPCHKKFFSFLFFVNDCDPPDVEALLDWNAFDAGGTPRTLYIFRLSVVGEYEDENCKIFTIRWECWSRSGVNPINPLSGGGAYKGILGKAGGQLEETPEWAGDRLFKTCCVKSKESGCALTCLQL